MNLSNNYRDQDQESDQWDHKTCILHQIRNHHPSACVRWEFLQIYFFNIISDYDNMQELEDLKTKDGTAKLLLLGEFDPQGEKIIRDPYYDSDAKGFEKAYEQSVRCCEAFLKKVLDGEI